MNLTDNLNTFKNVGFISTRFAGTDGVSLEANKWADFFSANGSECFWFAGLIECDCGRCLHVPEAHFKHEKNQRINSKIWGQTTRSPETTLAIQDLSAFLKQRLLTFIRDFEIDLLIAENVLAIPMHVPLGIALTEIIAETQIPTIAHHHDFYWERERYLVNAVNDYLSMAFPPTLPNLTHVVINSEIQKELGLRTGIAATVIPNVLDFANPPKTDPDKTRALRKAVGLEADDHMILQPTRVIKRKGIEHAVELVSRLNDSRYKLVISHESGDEGDQYANWLKELAVARGVDLLLVADCFSDPWDNHNGNGHKFSLWDIYAQADFVTFPSLQEGFGNAFLEAVYFKKPLLVNRYATFVKDIEPLGFDVTTMDGYLGAEALKQVKEILASPLRRKQMVSTNYQLASRYFSYEVLGERLSRILLNLRDHMPLQFTMPGAVGTTSAGQTAFSILKPVAGFNPARALYRRR